MKMTIDMPFVAECSAQECAYNVNKNCHARAITVGDGLHPGCDTYLGASKHTHAAKRTAGVGACKISGCRHNEDFECIAESIAVGMRKTSAQCFTFAAR